MLSSPLVTKIMVFDFVMFSKTCYSVIMKSTFVFLILVVLVECAKNNNTNPTSHRKQFKQLQLSGESLQSPNKLNKPASTLPSGTHGTNTNFNKTLTKSINGTTYAPVQQQPLTTFPSNASEIEISKKTCHSVTISGPSLVHILLGVGIFLAVFIASLALKTFC